MCTTIQVTQSFHTDYLQGWSLMGLILLRYICSHRIIISWVVLLSAIWLHGSGFVISNICFLYKILQYSFLFFGVFLKTKSAIPGAIRIWVAHRHKTWSCSTQSPYRSWTLLRIFVLRMLYNTNAAITRRKRPRGWDKWNGWEHIRDNRKGEQLNLGKVVS